MSFEIIGPIREVLKRRNMTIADLAAELDMYVRNVNGWLLAERTPMIDNLFNMLTFLGLELVLEDDYAI